jgi:hypothetical protein
MHEYAVLRTPERDVWIAKDARAGVLEQLVTVDLGDPEAWLPELPVAKRAGRLEVVDRSHDEWLDVDLAYENFDGQRVELSYVGVGPRTLQRDRNGSTMGHSRDAVYAVLDLSHRDFAERATLRFDGERVAMSRILGLVPFQAVLQQTQGGFAIGHYVEAPTADGFTTTHDTYSGGTRTLAWTLEPSEDGVDAVQRGDFRTLRYRFRRDGDALELASIMVEQWGRAAPTVAVTLEPPLPDLRRRFRGQATSAFVVDVNGQHSHAVGRLEAAWEGGEVVVELVPVAPWWTLDRPMRARVRDGEGGLDVRVERVATRTEGGS